MYIDIVCIILIAYGFYVGFTNGIIETIFKYLSIVIGVLVGFNVSKPVTDILKTVSGEQSNLLNILGIVITILLVMFIIRMLAKGLESILDAAGINILNKVFGGVLVGGILIFAYSWILWFVNSARLLSDQEIEASETYVYIEKVPDLAKDLWKGSLPTLSESWYRLIDATESLKDAVQEDDSSTTIKNSEDYDNYEEE